MQEMRRVDEKTLEEISKMFEQEETKGKVVELDEKTKRLNILTSSVQDEQILEAVRNPKNETVIIHKAGSIITMQDGISKYEVQEDGSWRRLE